MSVVPRPASGSPRKSEPSPPRMQEYSEKIKEGEITKSDHIRKFTLDWMGLDTPSESYMREIFDFFDHDHSGFLDKKEMIAVFTESFDNYGAPVDQRDIDRMFAKVDLNKNGRITFDEFCVLLLNKLKM